MNEGEPPPPQRAKLSAFVIAYNREAIIGTCLRALSFADEILVVDKGSTDATPAIAAGLADRVIRVPWTPTVEETRAFATGQCAHDWILFLDDDECFSPEAIRFIDAELRAPRAELYRFPLRHYIMGRHDERAYYWPEEHVRLFRKGALTFLPTVHGGMAVHADRQFSVPVETGACIHHLSHRDVAQWIEKSNRYTSQPDRRRSAQTTPGIGRYAHERIDAWLARGDTGDADAYPAAVAVLRAVYDLIDRLKGWEEEAGIDGDALFRAACARLDAAYAAELAPLARPHRHEGPIPDHLPGGSSDHLPGGSPDHLPGGSPDAPRGPPADPTPPAGGAALARAVLALQDSVQAQREAVAEFRLRHEAVVAERDSASHRARDQQARAEAAERDADTLRAAGDSLAHRLQAAEAAHAAAAAAAATAAANAHAAAASAAALREEIARHRQQGSTLHAQLADAQARHDATRHRLHTIESSTSWRLTGPLRRLLIRLGRA